MANPSLPTKSRDARWLVLGASGFIGRAVMSELRATGHHVIGASPSTRADSDWEVLDIFNAQQLKILLRRRQPNIMLNAIGHPPALAPAGLREFYTRSTEAILNAVGAEISMSRVVLLGSAAEYGNSPATGSSETDAPCPLTEYGRAKCEQFDLSCKFAAQKLTVTTARLFNPIGPGQSVHQFAGALRERLQRGEDPVRVEAANHIRDWLDVRDVARALVMLAESPQPPDVVNVCTGQGRTVESVAEKLAGLAGAKIEAVPGPVSDGVLWRSVGNPGRLFHLGWRPQLDLDTSLADLWHGHL